MKCVKERVLFAIRIAIHAFGGIIPMWIRKRRFEELQAKLEYMECCIEALYQRTREHNEELHDVKHIIKDIDTKVAYLENEIKGKKVLHG